MGAGNRDHQAVPEGDASAMQTCCGLRPSVGDRPVLAGRAATRPRGRGHGSDPLLWPRPPTSTATPAGRAGPGKGEGIPEPGKQMPSWRGGDPPVRLEIGVSATLRGRPTCMWGAKGLPRPWPTFPLRVPPPGDTQGLLEPGLSRGVVSRWMECITWECSPGGPCCRGQGSFSGRPGQVGAASLSLPEGSVNLPPP